MNQPSHNPRLRAYKVHMVCHGTVTGLKGKPEVTRWSVDYNVLSHTPEMAEQLCRNDVSDGVLVDSCIAIRVKRKEFRSIVDFDENDLLHEKKPVERTFGDSNG